MTRRRWIADQVNGDRAVLLGEHAAHLARVLRARVGQEYEISTGDRVRWGRIVSVSQERVEFEMAEEVAQDNRREIVLLLAVFRFDRMEWALEKATELGVTRIVPVIARRTEKHLSAAAAKRGERWRKIALQAAQQSRRVRPPEITTVQKLKDALRTEATTRIVLSENERGVRLRDALGDSATTIALAIGPEGGWTEDELAQIAAAGWTAASLGPGILRSETAAIAALAVVGQICPG